VPYGTGLPGAVVKRSFADWPVVLAAWLLLVCATTLLATGVVYGDAVATGGLQPDMTILLDLPVEVGLARKAPADRTRFESDFDLAFHRRVRNGFLALAVAEPGRFVVLDATADTDAIARRIARAVDHLVAGARTPADEPNRPLLRTTS